MLCEQCACDHDGEYGSGRFCSQLCARRFSTSKNRTAINLKISQKLAKHVSHIDDDQLKLCVIESKSWTQVFKKLGHKCSNATIKSFIKTRANELCLSLEHFKKNRSIDERLSDKFPHLSKPPLRHDLIKIGREYKCEECGLGPVWNNKKLTIQVDHINGDNLNHNPDNLRFLCPNCHSQTETFTWKNTVSARKSRFHKQTDC